MNYFIILFVYLFSTFAVYSEEIKIIDLHNDIKDETETNDNNIAETIIENNINETVILNEELLLDQNEEILADSSGENEESKSNLEEKELINNDSVNNEIDVVESLPDFWQNSDKEDLEFLFDNLAINNSKVLTSLLFDTLVGYVNAPNIYSQEEFDNLRIKTLINLGQTEKALSLINNINTYDNYKDYYDLLKLNYYFSINDLNNACNFKENFQENLNDKTNILLKINIFCSFIQNKVEEAVFLNSLLLDTNDNDDYFQKIFFNLKNDKKELIDISTLSFSDDLIAIYSAMLRIGNFPLNEKFLEYDPINFSLPIILSSSTDMFLRLKSAHKAYELGLLKAESLSALYQSVDFTYEQLNDSTQTAENTQKIPEMRMALLFQKANVQLLPITRLESLKEFWNYAQANNMELLAYDMSKNLIESIEPSEELFEYAILISRAHIYNKNFTLAERWIQFTDTYINDQVDLNVKELQSIKLLYDLKTSENNDSFINILIANLYNKESKLYEINNSDSLNDEILTTILSIIIQDANLSILLKENKQLLDERIMPSRYIIEKIVDSSQSNDLGELILSTNISMNGKLWSEINSYHLKILLESFSRVQLYDVFKDLIIEILEESKII